MALADDCLAEVGRFTRLELLLGRARDKDGQVDMDGVAEILGWQP
ncbi:hypothetical protein ACWD3I_24980 [Streptomyces sp. NPDC002817]